MYRFQHGIFILEYNGPLQEHRNTLLTNTVSSLRGEIAEKQARAILISLASAKAQGHAKELRQLVAMLAKLADRLPVVLGFVDYDAVLYKALRTLTEPTGLKLFKNFNAARLFVDPKSYKQGMQVLVFDEDETNARRLASELTKFGYSIVLAKSEQEYQELITERGFNICVTQSSLNKTPGADTEKARPAAPQLALSKKLITNLPAFVDTAVETLVSFTGLEAQKSSHAIKRFETGLEAKVLCAVMRFKGDIEGAFVLIFPLELACVAMEAMLGEAVGTDELESLQDGVGEFCNIITGGAKTLLSGQSIAVTFALPKTYTSLASTFEAIGDHNGVWIDMQLASKPFYMFITN